MSLQIYSTAANVTVKLEGPHGRILKPRVRRDRYGFQMTATLTAGLWRACAKSGGAQTGYRLRSSCTAIRR